MFHADLDIEELLTRNRVLFGDTRMEDTSEDGDTSEEEEESTEETEDDDTGEESEEDEDKPLGPKGEKALAAEKEKRRKAQQDLREWKALGLSPADIKKLIAAKEGDEPDLEAVKREAASEATKNANARILRSEIRAAAAGKLADPADALRLLDLDKFEVDDDGNVDEDEIADAIDELVKNKPYLAVQDGKRFKGKADGGTRKESRPAQLTEADVKKLAAEGKHAEIEKARTEGRLNELLGVTS